MNRNIHKIDDCLILGGLVVLVLVVLVAWLGFGRPSLLWVWGSGAVFAMCVGYVLREREKKVLVVWNALELVTEITMADLCANTGLDRPKVRESLELINAQPSAFFIWDPKTDLICDGRLNVQVLAVAQCASCGAGVNQKFTLDLREIPACPFCKGPVVDSDINHLKLGFLNKIREDTKDAKSAFSIILFVSLLAVCWPAAIAYAILLSGIIPALKAAKSIRTYQGPTEDPLHSAQIWAKGYSENGRRSTP